MKRGQEPVSLELTRTQMRLLCMAANRLLRDFITCPRGPERRSLELAVKRLHEAREREATP